MSELRHMLSAANFEQLRDLKPLLEDPLKMHKTRFVRWLELKSEALYTGYLAAGMSEQDAMAKTTADLVGITEEWKAAARAKRHAR